MSEPADRKWQELVRRHAEVARRTEHGGTAPEHRPEVAVLACSDARVPPTVLFGQEPGSSFVVRLAGNSATPGAIASLTYAVEHLGVDLIVVLGHTGCGAVTAALEGVAEPGLNPILTPIDEMLVACESCGDVAAAVVANVRHNVRRLERARGALGAAVADGRVTIRGAVHDLTTGELIDLDALTPSNQSTIPTTARHTPGSTPRPLARSTT